MIWIWIIVGLASCQWADDHPGHAAIDLALAAGLVATHKAKKTVSR